MHAMLLFLFTDKSCATVLLFWWGGEMWLVSHIVRKREGGVGITWYVGLGDVYV